MKKIYLTVLLSAIFTAGFGQANCKIKKASAYYTVSTPGMQAIDMNGNPIPPIRTIERFIYIETASKKKPEIISTFYDQAGLSVIVTAVEGNKAVLGSNFSNNPDFNVQAKKCNRLWKLDLTTTEGKDMPKLNCKNIVINIKTDTGAACSFKISGETVLNLLPRY